jgi:tetratricopeptide (TPR) repeat protein
MTDDLSPQEIVDRARQTYQAGDYLQAARAFAQAASAFASSGDLPMSAELKNNQSVALLLSGEPQAALEAVEGTETVFADSKDFRRQGMALANQASALEALKRFKDAIESYKRAADALENANEGDMRAAVMQLLANLYLRHFKFYDAVITLQSGMAGLKNPTPKQRFMKKILFIRLGR